MRWVLPLCLLFGLPAFAKVHWRGDFETDDLSQWSAQIVNNDRMQIVDSPVREGKHAVKVTVRPGDNPIHSSGNRNELVNPEQQREGTDAYFRWSTMWPEDYPSHPQWQVFTQFHQVEDCCGSPPIQFIIRGDEISFTASQQQTLLWSAPLVRGKWHDFILRIKFSDNSEQGFVELWYDGEKVVNRYHTSTRANSYLKQGLYRSNEITSVATLYHDGMIKGDSLDDVWPASQLAPGPADAPHSSDNAPSEGDAGSDDDSTTGSSTGLRGEGPGMELTGAGCSTSSTSPSSWASIVGFLALCQAALWIRAKAAAAQKRKLLEN